MDIQGMPWFMRGTIAPPRNTRVSQLGGKFGRRRRTLGEKRLIRVVKAHELGDGGPEDVKVEEADAWAGGVEGEGEGKVHWGGRQRGRVGRGEGRTCRPATVLLPTPPFPLATARTAPTLGMDRFWGGPVPLRGI